MNDNGDHRLKAIFDEIVVRTPDIGPTPSSTLLSAASRHSRSRRVLFAAAASVVAIGVAGLAWTATGRDRSVGPAAAPTESSASTASAALDQSAPAELSPPANPAEIPTPTDAEVPSGAPTEAALRGGPTLYPMLDAAAVSDAPITGNLNYVGAGVEPQANAVVARFEDDASTSDFYTFVAGDGANAHADGVGLATDASTLQVTDIGGIGYAVWTTDGVPVLVMAPDPSVLLDDPAFSMNVSLNDDGEATIEFESLPAGFEPLVAPRRFAGEAATAQLLIGSSGAPDAIAGNIAASLDHPLTNLNLTEGSTISPTSPTQPGDIDGWIVSFPDSDNRAVVWSPDGTTWVALHWSGSEEDLITLARAVTFTDSVGEWMASYQVDLPPVHFEVTTASG